MKMAATRRRAIVIAAMVAVASTQTPTYSPAVDGDNGGGGMSTFTPAFTFTVEPSPSVNALAVSAAPSMSAQSTFMGEPEDREPAIWGTMRLAVTVNGLRLNRLRSRGFGLLQPVVEVLRRFLREGLRQVQINSGLDAPGRGDTLVSVIVEGVRDTATAEEDHLSPWDAVNAGDQRRRLELARTMPVVPQPPVLVSDEADVNDADVDGADWDVAADWDIDGAYELEAGTGTDFASARRLQAGGGVTVQLLTTVPMGTVDVDNATLAAYGDMVMASSDTQAALTRTMPAVATSAGLQSNSLTIAPEGSATADYVQDDPTLPPPPEPQGGGTSIAAAAGGGAAAVVLLVAIGIVFFFIVQSNKAKLAVTPVNGSINGNVNGTTTVYMTGPGGGAATAVPIQAGPPGMKTVVIAPAAGGSYKSSSGAPVAVAASPAAVFAGGDSVLAVVDDSAPLKRGSSNPAVAVAAAAGMGMGGGAPASWSGTAGTVAGDPSPSIGGAVAITVDSRNGGFGGSSGPSASGGAGGGGSYGGGGRSGGGSGARSSATASSSASGTVAMARSIGIADVTLDPGPPLGVGSYGMVRGGMWRDEPVAVKFLYTDEDAFDAAAVTAFRKEVELQYGLRHRNVVAVYGCIVDEGTKPMPTYAVVMERLACSAYRRFVGTSAPRASLQAKLRLLIDVATGLRFLHNDGVLHLDMKPGESARVQRNMYWVLHLFIGDR